MQQRKNFSGHLGKKRMVAYKGISIRLSTGFSAETLQARGEWNDILKILKDKNFQRVIRYPAKLLFRYEGGIKAFPDQQKLREFITTRSIYKKC